MTEYSPDSWVVLRMTHDNKTYYKVLGGWVGGYINSDNWRLSSAIVKCEYDVASDRFKFHNASGSVYHCYPDTYGLRLVTSEIYGKMTEMYKDKVVLLDKCNWCEMDWTQ